jgi:redox-sensitive bicupin YhaK (pirin superfamily)
MSNLLPPGNEATDLEGSCSTIIYTIQPRARDLGGFQVRRVLPNTQHQMIGPWIFFDEMGPASFPTGEGIDVRPHPHINLATVTYLFEGEILHRDSLGCVQPIRPGAVNLMIAGRGIVHSERTPPGMRQSPHKLHGLQLWLALPEACEETDPEFLHYEADSLPEHKEPGLKLRLLIGEGYGLKSPVKTLSTTFYAEIFLEAGHSFTLPDHIEQRGLYLISGQLSAKDSKITSQTMTLFAQEPNIQVHAHEDSRFAIIGGSHLGHRHIWWNFVSSREDRIQQAKLDWDNGNFPSVPGELEEIPLPK